MALLGLVTDDDDGQSASVTLEGRLKEFFDAANLEGLRIALNRHEHAQGLSLAEKKAIRAATKVMSEVLREPA